MSNSRTTEDEQYTPTGMNVEMHSMRVSSDNTERSEYLEILSERPLVLKDDNSAILQALNAGWDNVKDYLQVKKSVIHPDTFVTLFKIACKQINFEYLTLLIESYAVTFPVPKNISYPIGSVWDVLDTNHNWIPATIMESNGDNVKIHYVGYPDKWDETLDIKKSFYRFAPHQTYSNNSIEISNNFFEWQKYLQQVFSNAETATDMEFVHKHLVQFIDTNNIAYLQKLLSHAIEIGYLDKIILLLLSLKAVASTKDIEKAYTNKSDNILIPLIESNEKESINAYNYCKRAAIANLWLLAEKFYNQAFFNKFPQVQIDLVEIAFSQFNFEQVKKITQFDGSPNGLNLNAEHAKQTFVKAENQDDWIYVYKFLNEFKTNPNINSIINELFKRALACDVDNETLVLLRLVGNITLDEELINIALAHNKLGWIKYNEKDILGALAVKKAEQNDWSMADLFLENTPIPDKSIQALFITVLKQYNLDKLITLSSKGFNITSAYIRQLPIASMAFTLKVNDEFCYQTEDETWCYGRINYIREDQVFIHFKDKNEEKYSGWEWVDRKAYPLRLKPLATVASKKLSIDLKKRIEDTLLTAVTEIEWEFVCQTLKEMSDKTKDTKKAIYFDSIILAKLFSRALQTHANAKVLSALLSLGTVILTSHVLKSIAEEISLDWLREVKQENLLELVYRSAFNKNWSLVSDFIEYLKFKKDLFQDLLKIAITGNQFGIMRQLVMLGASIPALDLRTSYTFNFDIKKMGVEPGVTIDGKADNGDWHQMTVFRRESHIVTGAYYIGSESRYLSLNIKEGNDRTAAYKTKTCSDNVNTTEATIAENLKLTVLKAVTYADFVFVCNEIEKAMPDEYKTVLQALLEQALKNHALSADNEGYSDEDAVSYMISQHDTFTPTHLSLAFKLPTSKQLNTLLREDKQVSSDVALVEAGRKFRWDKVHVYLDVRIPQVETLTSLILYATSDYEELKKLIARRNRFKDQMPVALKSCFVHAFNNQLLDLAQMLVVIGKLPVWDAIFLTATTSVQLEFVSDYLDRMGYINVARENVQQFINHALNQKSYTLALNLLNNYTQYFLKKSNPHDPQQILLSDLFKYCHDKLDAKGNIIQVKNTIWNKGASTPEVKFVAACKLIDYMLSKVNNFSQAELNALNSSDLKFAKRPWLLNPSSTTNTVRRGL